MCDDTAHNIHRRSIEKSENLSVQNLILSRWIAWANDENDKGLRHFQRQTKLWLRLARLGKWIHARHTLPTNHMRIKASYHKHRRHATRHEMVSTYRQIRHIYATTTTIYMIGLDIRIFFYIKNVVLYYNWILFEWCTSNLDSETKLNKKCGMLSNHQESKQFAISQNNITNCNGFQIEPINKLTSPITIQ